MTENMQADCVPSRQARFNQCFPSYDKFVTAAKEGADCFIEWMRRCDLWQNLALLLMPYFLLGLLPFGARAYMNGTVTGSDLLMLIIDLSTNPSHAY